MDELKYFRSNIYISKSAYNGWKMLRFSKSKNIVSEEMADKYVGIQNQYPEFFGTVERSLLITWVTQVLHSFDRNSNSVSLRKISEDKLNEFLLQSDHNEIYSKLKMARDKLFAHKDKNVDELGIVIPPIEQMDTFFTELEKLYSTITRDIDGSVTSFMNADNIKQDIEKMFMNLERGETQRRKEIDIKYMWQESKRKASDTL